MGMRRSFLKAVSCFALVLAMPTAADDFDDMVAAERAFAADAAGPPPTWSVGVAELRTADMVPAGQLNSRLVSADFLRIRQGQLPDGRAEGTAMSSTATRLDTGLVISGAGDLGANWGGGAGSPALIRVWRRPSAEDAPGHGWTLAADFALPAAQPVK